MNGNQYSHLRLFRVICAGFLLLACCLVAQAQDESSKRRTAQTLSTSGYRSLNEAREAINAEDYDAAEEVLRSVTSGSRYSDYDKAKAWQLQSFVHVSREEYPQAIEANRQALALNVLDHSSKLESLYTLANLYAYTEEYAQSIDYLEQWFALAENPDAQAYFTAAQVYAMTKALDKGLSHAEKGMQLHRNDPQAEPRESWYRLLLAIRLQLKMYAQGSELLEDMIELWPANGEYYSQLSALYRELERELDALLVTSVARQNGLLDRLPDFERLTQLYRYHDYPYKGASVLDGALQRDNSEDDQIWKLLGDAYAQSREWDKAKAAYLSAAQYADSGEHWLRLCQTAYHDGNWNEAGDYCNNALTAGGLKTETAYAWQILAMARYNRAERQLAMDAFRKCGEWEEVAKTCEQWLAHIEQEIEREKAEAERRQKEEESARKQLDQLEDAVESALYFL